MAAMSCVACARSESQSKADSGRARAQTPFSNAAVSVSRPTVIAYFVIPPGAVDSLPDLAVEADDWNVSMATLGDSLEANGFGFAMATDSTVRVDFGAGRDSTISLGPFKSSGYVFVRPKGPTCTRQGGADADSVLAMARAIARGGGCA